MATIWVRKLYDTFAPADEMSLADMEKFTANDVYKAEITKPRNLGFHRKFFSLLKLSYENYEQPEVFYNDIRVFRSFERFRGDITIACGYWDLELNKNNKVIQVPKSISFSKMEQVEFEKLFSKAIDVIMADYLTSYTDDDMNILVQRVLSYA